MNQEFNLDSFKEAWKSQSSEKTYEYQDIFNMLKRKSITSVKWIFIVSLIEISIAVVMYIYMFSNDEIYRLHLQLLDDIGNFAYVFEVITFIVYGITGYFIYKFYKSYKQIKVQSSVKELSNDIINLRKTVNQFIYFNCIVLFIVCLLLIIPQMQQLAQDEGILWTSSKGLTIIGLTAAIFLVSLGFLWLYYFIVYGTFQRRLKRNLKELNNLED